jgi:hypothetical protein
MDPPLALALPPGAIRAATEDGVTETGETLAKKKR